MSLNLKIMIRKVFFLLIIYNLSIILIYSQDIKKDITIVKPYQPTIQDFYKINLMPSFSDTSYMSPQFNYLIKSVKIDVPYQPKNIPIAKIAPESTTSLLNNYLKLGIGNPNSPYAEVSFTNGRDKNTHTAFI